MELVLLKLFLISLITPNLIWTNLNALAYTKYPEHCGITPNYPKGQIVGGEIVPPAEYTWLASLHYKLGNTYGCGGIVINELYLLTAAHCVRGKIVDSLGGLSEIRVGDFSQKPYCDYGYSNCTSYQSFGIAEIIVHENFYEDDKHLNHNDIALIRLDRKIIFSGALNPICLPQELTKLKANTILTVVGRGNAMTRYQSIHKRAVDIPLWDNESCKHEGTICAGYTGRGSCFGDSGSPLMFKGKGMELVGIVSQSLGMMCAGESMPTFFTDVTYHMDWIDVNMIDQRSTKNNTGPQKKKFHDLGMRHIQLSVFLVAVYVRIVISFLDFDIIQKDIEF